MSQYGKRSFSILLLLAMSFVIFTAASPETYTVGDRDGWKNEVDFASWSQRHHFEVGDFLLFKYAKGEHDVCEVTEPAYGTCDPRDGSVGKYESGNDAVELKEAKTYWFICDVPGHCLGGMRIVIHVKHAPNPPNSTNLPPPPSSCVLAHPSQILISVTLFFSLSATLFKIF